MTDLLKHLLISQFEASLAMYKQRIEVCPADHWDGKIANDTFLQTAYHALFYLDLYLSPDESAFALSDLNIKGGDDRQQGIQAGLGKEDLLLYVEHCLEKIRTVVDSETAESLQGPSGISWRKTSRAELHVYNIRHFQHHIGQLSTFLRRISNENNLSLKMIWVGEGWKS
ncbi:MAG: DinB family protein [bacterium]